MSRALFFFALAAGSDVAGEFLFTYHDWNEIYGIPGASADICYALAYVFAAAGFYMLIKRWATKDKKDVIKKT
ncbi:hypothetical protein GF351_05430 [Candidatus Woesearchaeota archaeon]|nr:hypothetical protein [Candidatus Woesearchaeota archaeon]